MHSRFFLNREGQAADDEGRFHCTELEENKQLGLGFITTACHAGVRYPEERSKNLRADDLIDKEERKCHRQ
jgi:hypothetical protein